MDAVCAVTGAGGYVGSRIASALARDFDVVPMGRRVGGDGIVWSLGEGSVQEVFRERQVKVLVHSAWDFNHTSASSNHTVNVEGSRRLIEDAQNAGADRIIFISTISAFEGARSEYGKSKLAVERIVLEAGGTVIRPGLVWGNNPGGMFASLKKQVNKGKIVPMIGDGSYLQYLVHEEDLAEAVRRSASAETAPEFAGQVLTVAHPQAWSLRDLILGMAKAEGKKITLAGIPWRMVYGALKAAEMLGLKPGFRSDSLISLIYSNPAPAISREVPVRAFRYVQGVTLLDQS